MTGESPKKVARWQRRLHGDYRCERFPGLRVEPEPGAADDEEAWDLCNLTVALRESGKRWDGPYWPAFKIGTGIADVWIVIWRL